MKPDSILAFLTKNFQLGDLRRVRALADMVFGLMKAGHVSFASIGRSMAGDALPASRITRVYRFCHNEAVDPAAVQASLIRCLVGRTVGGSAPSTEIVPVSFDWHTYDNGEVTGLRVSLVTGSRALPLLWYELWTGNLKGQQSKIEQQAIRDLIRLRPPGVKWVILLDAGFRSSALIPLLEEAGYYILRQRITTLVHSGTNCWAQIRTLPVRVGQVVEFGWTYWASSNPTPTRIVAARLYRGKKPRRGRRTYGAQYHYTDPGFWAVSTNLEIEKFSAADVIRFYARRFEIEHNFRDLKNASLGMNMERAHLTETEVYSRLLCIVAVAEALLWLVGSEAESRGLHKSYTPSRPRDGRRVISLRNLGQLCLDISVGSIGRLLKTHLRRAILASPSVNGTNWKNLELERFLKKHARTRQELPSLEKRCRCRYGGKRAAPCTSSKWQTVAKPRQAAQSATTQEAA